MPTKALEDARGAQWRKLIFNAASNAIAALTGMTHGQIAESRHSFRLKDVTPLAGASDDLDFTPEVKGVTDKESMRAPMTGVDGVFHVAGWYKVGVKDKSAGRAVHIDGTRNVLQLMRELCALPSTRVQEKRRTATGLTRWGSNASRSAWRCSARRS